MCECFNDMPIDEEEINVLTKQAEDTRSEKGKTAWKMLQLIYLRISGQQGVETCANNLPNAFFGSFG